MDDGSQAADADRDRAAALLHDHSIAGRLTAAELDDRLAIALRATTSGDLRRALASLPESAAEPQPDGSLECGYRRLLAFYPAAHRCVHGEEMLAVLMTGAPPWKRRPGLAEAADLIVGALRVWCQPSREAAAGWRRALALISATALLGLLGGIAFAAVNPSLPRGVAAYIRIPGEAHSGPGNTDDHLIVERAALRVRPAVSLRDLQSQVQTNRAYGRVLVISAHATTMTQARRAAEAVANSYAAYVNSKLPGRNGNTQAELLATAMVPPRVSLATEVLDTGGLGALCGGMIGATTALALNRPSKRFRMT